MKGVDVENNLEELENNRGRFVLVNNGIELLKDENFDEEIKDLSKSKRSAILMPKSYFEILCELVTL